MKKAVLTAWLAVGSIYAYGQSTTTTMVGTVRDLTGAIVTSGRITYELNAPQGGVIPGTGSFVSTIVSCQINATGNPVSSTDGTSPCVITSNSAITPTGTSYKQCTQPYNVSPGSCINMYATGGTIDVSTIVPTPTTGPFSYANTPGPPGPMGPNGPPGGSLSYPGVVSDGSNGVNVSGSTTAQATTASVNTVLYVKAPPYNAKCDGTTDDRAAIQLAFNDALAGSSNPLCTAFGCSVQFPAGKCLSSTIVWKGQSFFGAGMTASTIQGKPGQDVLQTPDGNTWTPPLNGALVHDIRIFVDNSVDASGAPQGNNAFPNRIAGTLGGAANPVSPAISPGPGAFGNYNGFATGCTALINGAALNTLVLAGCPSLTSTETWRIVGAPITIKTVGPAGADLVTTIASVVNATTLTLTTPASSAGSGLSGTMLNPITPPWYMGNCGFAFQNSNGATPAPNLNHFTFTNVWITSVGGPYQGNHSCGMWVQAPPYSVHLTQVGIQALWGGYVEAKPATNPNSTTWAGDTSSFTDLDLYDTLPLVIFGGGHRRFSNVNIYGSGNQWQSMGAFFLGTSGSATISRFYFECGFATGEIERFTSTYGINITGGALDQCTASTHYVLWNASQSTIDAQINNLQIADQANLNNFRHTQLVPAFIADNGSSNFIETNGSSNPNALPRAFYANRPQEPLGKIDAGWLVSGNSAAPFTSGSDLMMTCPDFNFSTFFNGTAYVDFCVHDPTGAEFPRTYFQALQSNSQFTAGVFTLAPSGNLAGPMGRLLTIGDRLPKAPMTFVVLEQCPNGACTQTYLIQDASNAYATLASATLSFGTGWTIQTLPVDFSSIAVGHNISVRAQTTAPWTTGSEVDIATWAFAPINADTINRIVLKGTTASIGGSALAAGACASGTATITGVVAGQTGDAAPTDGASLAGYSISSYGTAANTATVWICALAAGTPPAKSYNVRVFP